MTPRTTFALAADGVLVIVFAALGRAEHERGSAVLGALETAWPFLVGTATGWLLVTQLGRRVPIEVGPGVTVWVCTVVVGMLLRQLAGRGTAFSFIVVATVVLGAFLLGWRAANEFLQRRRAGTPGP